MIKVTGVVKHFGRQAVLSGIDLSVPEGQSFVILGQSGVGKSVLLKIIAGLLDPTSGSVQIGTENIGMLFQKNALFDSLSIFDNLDFTLRERTTLSKAERLKSISRYLDWVGLPGTERQFPDELSGGMQKRLGIARALIVEPQVILYDEPTAGLDPITSRMIADLIIRLKKESNATILTVTSDVMRAYQMADEIALLANGPSGSTLVPAGSPSQTKLSKDARVQQFICGNTSGPLTDRQDNHVD